MMNLSLYQQHLDLVHLMNQAEIELAEGGVTPETEELLNQALTNIPQKVDRCVNFVEWCDAQHEFLSSQIAVLKGQQDSLKAAQDRMKRAVLNCMSLTSEKRLQGELRAFGLRKSEAVEIKGQVPEEFTRVKTVIEPDKLAIKAAIKAGKVIENCELVERVSVVTK